MAPKHPTDGEIPDPIPDPAPLIGVEELGKLSFYGAILAEFIATLLFLYVTILTVIGHKSLADPTKNKGNACNGVGLLGIAWSFGGMIFVLVYCTGGISGGFSFTLSLSFFSCSKIHLTKQVISCISTVTESLNR